MAVETQRRVLKFHGLVGVINNAPSAPECEERSETDPKVDSGEKTAAERHTERRTNR